MKTESDDFNEAQLYLIENGAPQIMTIRQAARFSRLSYSNLWRAAHSGALAARRVGSPRGPIRISRAALARYIMAVPV
ncbi:MAG: helix-turn-helix domain-containing protein [Planctomycetes bacterium]|nr:helix-turn-helix domain-containing protein [Planctomycetota bacterium]